MRARIKFFLENDDFVRHPLALEEFLDVSVFSSSACTLSRHVQLGKYIKGGRQLFPLRLAITLFQAPCSEGKSVREIAAVFYGHSATIY